MAAPGFFPPAPTGCHQTAAQNLAVAPVAACRTLFAGAAAAEITAGDAAVAAPVRNAEMRAVPSRQTKQKRAAATAAASSATPRAKSSLRAADSSDGASGHSPRSADSSQCMLPGGAEFGVPSAADFGDAAAAARGPDPLSQAAAAAADSAATVVSQAAAMSVTSVTAGEADSRIPSAGAAKQESSGLMSAGRAPDVGKPLESAVAAEEAAVSPAHAEGSHSSEIVLRMVVARHGTRWVRAHFSTCSLWSRAAENTAASGVHCPSPKHRVQTTKVTASWRWQQMMPNTGHFLLPGTAIGRCSQRREGTGGAGANKGNPRRAWRQNRRECRCPWRKGTGGTTGLGAGPGSAGRGLAWSATSWNPESPGTCRMWSIRSYGHRCSQGAFPADPSPLSRPLCSPNEGLRATAPAP